MRGSRARDSRSTTGSPPWGFTTPRVSGPVVFAQSQLVPITGDTSLSPGPTTADTRVRRGAPGSVHLDKGLMTCVHSPSLA